MEGEEETDLKPDWMHIVYYLPSEGRTAKVYFHERKDREKLAKVTKTKNKKKTTG